MEDIHGVDVSWLHQKRDHHHRQYAPSSPGLTRDTPPRTSAHGGHPPERPLEERKPLEPAPAVQTPSSPAPKATTNPAPVKTPTKRPTLLNRSSSEKVTPPDSKPSSRRNSWISSISNKFSSQNPPAQTTHVQAQGLPAPVNTAQSATSLANGAANGTHATNGGPALGDQYVPQQPKGSFLTNALRRLSSGSQVQATGTKLAPHGGICPRRVMNVDPNRDRCLVPELDQNKLRRVAFCVDVEIAGGPKYKDDVDSEEKKKKRKDKKLKERGEGEALKHPEILAEEKEKDGVVQVSSVPEAVGNEEEPNPEGTVLDEESKEGTKKKEKKKRSEAERKERKEKKRRKAEENGSVPLELSRDDSTEESSSPPVASGVPPPRPQDRPTTDPLRIYRRCCQLRETPILKRISDQLANPSLCAVATPGVVTCLDLTGSRLQLADYLTLSDWLAVVPVKKLFLEDSDLNDEKVRVVLAGLLAARISGAPRRRSTSRENSANGSHAKLVERSGVVKKLVLKNNPKITKEGWKHISLFIYMCKSVQAIDVSMIPFPRPVLPSQQTSEGPDEIALPKSHPSKDTADILSKSISERLGGSCLEELVMAECSLAPSSMRKIIDGAIISGIQRLSVAGNAIDDEGLEHVIHYIRSGVCQGLDLGGNDLRVGLRRIVNSLSKNCPLWALSLADCELAPEHLRFLLPALTALPTFRFLDLSHNKLLSNETSLCLLRKYLPQLKELKRIHLMDTEMTTAEVIALSEIIPQCTHLAHINIMENPAITEVSSATDVASQEEAAALYASLMAAAKLSHTLVCVDVDVPAPEMNEVVKALAKQVVAYCLRNMENFSEIPELKPVRKEVAVPDVLMHLVGHTEDFSENHDNDEPAPDNDYIVGGTGVVKALSYCLLQKATDMRRVSLPPSGTVTPRSQTGADESTKARTTSHYLLGSARNIRARLQPALVREAKAGNDMAYRKLLFLDQTLQGMIQRFEDEYPETRLPGADTSSTHSSVASTSPPASTVPTLSTSMTEAANNESDEEEAKAIRSRHNSDVNLASRALSLEEGRLHRLGHRIRAELINGSRPSSSQSDRAPTSGSMDDIGLPPHILALREKFATLTGEEMRNITESVGWEKAFDQVVENAEELKRLEKESPEEFARFREAQIATLKNRDPGQHPIHALDVRTDYSDRTDDVAVED